jgi:hypothetical protein
VTRLIATLASQKASLKMSLNHMIFHPATAPGLAELRTASAERERATLAFQAKYSAAVALRRRQGAENALDQGPARTGAWMDGNTNPDNGWPVNPVPDQQRIH